MIHCRSAPAWAVTSTKSYERYCKGHGELRARPKINFLNYIGKQPGWSAAKPEKTWANFQDRRRTNRKMVIPSEAAMQHASTLAPEASDQAKYSRRPEETKIEWLTRGYFAFVNSMGTN